MKQYELRIQRKLFDFVEAVRRNPFCKRPSETDYRVEAAEWLRLANDRNGGRKAREQRKRQKQTRPASSGQASADDDDRQLHQPRL